MIPFAKPGASDPYVIMGAAAVDALADAGVTNANAQQALALFGREVSVDDVLASPMLMPGVMTRLMACPPICGR